MQETLFDYLSSLSGYEVRGERLRRPDGSSAAYREGDHWRPTPTDTEMRDYMIGENRGLPSLLVEKDLTNPGHGTTPPRPTGNGFPAARITDESFDNPLYKAQIMHDARIDAMRRRK